MLGVTVGKFNPPHRGHLHLIETAARRVDRLVVVLGDRPDQTLRAHERQSWLADDTPDNVEVIVTPDDLPEAPEPWARRTIELLGHAPDLAFTSEDYGQAWASAMGCSHVYVDPERQRHPISGSELRTDLRRGFRWLIPAAKAALAKRVTLVGAESTGKSTLARGLADHYATTWVPEHGRWYWEGRRYLQDQRWSPDEFLRIAEAQRRLHADLARKADGGLIIADTDALVTSVWHRRYLSNDHAELDRLAEADVPDLYLVCAPDFPWHQDGTRESDRHRREMHDHTLAAVETSGARWAALTGPHPERLLAAVAHVEPLVDFPPLR